MRDVGTVEFHPRQKSISGSILKFFDKLRANRK